MKRQKIRKGLILFSFFLFPALFYYFSPALILQASSEGIINGSWIIFGLLFLSSLMLGRGFCGWLCPAAGCQEALFAARNKRVTKGNILKWIIWFPWMAGIVYLAYSAGGYHRIEFGYQTIYGLSTTDVQSTVTYFCVLLILIVFPAFVFGKRSFCHHLCWMAPFMILGRWLSNTSHTPSLHLRADKQLCVGCHKCSAHCPMSLPVDEMVKRKQLENRECILCGTCIDICQNGVIHFSLKR